MNQYRILSLLDQSNAEHYDKLRDALEEGYVASYRDDLFAGMRDGLSVEQCAFVVEVMNMYEASSARTTPWMRSRGSRRSARSSQGSRATTSSRTWVTHALLLRGRDGSAT